jgi:proteasome lid subunit RPN8/RPN11
MTTSIATVTDRYCLELAFTDENRAPVHSERLADADFDRAVYAAWFSAFRQSAFDAYAPRREAARVEPVFADEGGTARAKGFRVCLPTASGEFTQEFRLKYFAAAASRLRAALRRGRELPEEADLYYTLEAYLEDSPAARRSGSLVLEDASLEIPVRVGARPAGGVVEAWDAPRHEDLPVVVARSLLEDACEEAKRHPDREVGGLILGHLRRDDASGETFVEATCIASGEGTTEASQASVTFTADSFVKARRLIELRAGSGAPAEIVVGWYHSHPFRYCAECPLPTPPECLAKVLFYSEDDVQLMESTFYQPFMIGLLAAIEPRIEADLGHLPVKLFGWSAGGEIVPRGFEVIG